MVVGSSRCVIVLVYVCVCVQLGVVGVGSYNRYPMGCALFVYILFWCCARKPSNP